MNFEDKTTQSSRKWGGMAIQSEGFTYTIVTLHWRAVLTYIVALDGISTQQMTTNKHNKQSGKRHNCGSDNENNFVRLPNIRLKYILKEICVKMAVYQSTILIVGWNPLLFVSGGV